MESTTTPVAPVTPPADGPVAATEAPAKATPAKAKPQAKVAVPLHSNPRIAKALAEFARNSDKYDSAAALARAMGINDMPTQRSLRQVMRDAGLGVGRGKRYQGITAPKVAKAAQSNAKKAKQSAKA